MQSRDEILADELLRTDVGIIAFPFPLPYLRILASRLVVYWNIELRLWSYTRMP